MDIASAMQPIWRFMMENNTQLKEMIRSMVIDLLQGQKQEAASSQPVKQAPRGQVEPGVFDTVDDAIQAAKAAHAMEFIDKLDDGLDTIIGENGASLSGGQRQRLAIARALLRNSPVLVLDEATSALDTESERAIQSALAELQKDKTVLVIAHRLSTIRNADVIMVMDHGEIIERGNHESLMEKQGVYYQLYTGQLDLD